MPAALAPQQAAEEDFARRKSLLLRFGRKKRLRLLGGANDLLLIFKNRACLLRLVLPGNEAKGIVHGFHTVLGEYAGNPQTQQQHPHGQEHHIAVNKIITRGMSSTAK